MQVPPAELEHILHSHPDITEAAVIPYPDEAAGQVPMAFVVRSRGSTIDETQVKDFVAKQVYFISSFSSYYWIKTTTKLTSKIIELGCTIQKAKKSLFCGFDSKECSWKGTKEGLN